MIDNSDFRQQKKVAIAQWADKYTTRFDQELTNAWPDLADRLEEGIATLSWKELAFGPGKGFERRRIDLAVESWVQRYVQPILEDASQELHNLLTRPIAPLDGNAPLSVEKRRNLKTRDVLEGLTLPAGVLLAGATVSTAIVSTTKLLILTTVVVHWPLLIAGLVGGGILIAFGSTRLAGLKHKLRERFLRQLLPPIKEGIVGEGIEKAGRKTPSLLRQFKNWVKETAEAAQKALPS